MNQPSIDRVVIGECLSDGTEGVQQMIGDVSGLVEQFRQCDLGPANYGLAQLAHNLKALIILVQSLRPPVADLQLMATLPSEQDVATLASWLEALVNAQAGQDWLTVADVLEYDLEPALRAWCAQMETVRQLCVQ